MSTKKKLLKPEIKTKEIWAHIKIPEFSRYEISTHGRVRRNGKTKYTFINSRNRIQVNLYHNCKRYPKNISVLMAITFMNHITNQVTVVDHDDNNPLNNHISNLKIITSRYNSSKDVKNKTSRFTGVSKTRNGKWLAQIYIKGDRMSLGRHIDEGIAKLVYIEALKNLQEYKGNAKLFRELIINKINEQQ